MACVICVVVCGCVRASKRHVTVHVASILVCNVRLRGKWLHMWHVACVLLCTCVRASKRQTTVRVSCGICIVVRTYFRASKRQVTVYVACGIWVVMWTCVCASKRQMTIHAAYAFASGYNDTATLASSMRCSACAPACVRVSMWEVWTYACRRSHETCKLHRRREACQTDQSVHS